MQAQVLDAMDLERERGITARDQGALGADALHGEERRDLSTEPD
jgi:translation elongation factor EF-4